MESKEAEKEDLKEEKWQGRGKRVRKWPRGSEGSRKRIWLPGQCWTCGRIGHKSAECNVHVVGDAEQQPGVDAVTNLGLWVVCWRCPKEVRWQKPEQVAHEKAKFMQGYGGLVKISTGVLREGGVEGRWMPGCRGDLESRSRTSPES